MKASALNSIKEVAADAGVSVGTVSNVLNRPDLVAPATRAAVESSIRKLGFVVNQSARQLREGRSRTIGLVVPDITNPFFAEVSRGVEHYASSTGYSVILCNSDEAADRESSHLRVLQEQRVRGILLSPTAASTRELKAIRARGIPVVLLDRPGPRGQCSVAVNDVRGGDLAVSHLLELGHKHIGFVGGPQPMSQQCVERHQGARQAMRRAGLDPDRDLVEFMVPAMNAQSGFETIPKILKSRQKLTAIFCANDLLALGVMRGLHQAGVPVPEHMSVVGYDDIDFAADAFVSLTTVRQPMYQLGWKAAELMLAEAEASGDHEHQALIFEPELVVRESTMGIGLRASAAS